MWLLTCRNATKTKNTQNMKNIPLVSFAILFCVVFAFPSCNYENSDKWHYRITIQNNSDKAITYQDFYISPEITIAQAQSIAASYAGYSIKPGMAEDFVSNVPDHWEAFFHNLPPTDTLVLFIFDADSYKTSIEKSCIVGYKLTLDFLRQMNWHIYYPPTPEMRDMEMTPSYEEIINGNN